MHAEPSSRLTEDPEVSAIFVDDGSTETRSECSTRSRPRPSRSRRAGAGEPRQSRRGGVGDARRARPARRGSGTSMPTGGSGSRWNAPDRRRVPTRSTESWRAGCVCSGDTSTASRSATSWVEGSPPLRRSCSTSPCTTPSAEPSSSTAGRHWMQRWPPRSRRVALRRRAHRPVALPGRPELGGSRRPLDRAPARAVDRRPRRRPRTVIDPQHRGRGRQAHQRRAAPPQAAAVTSGYWPPFWT